MRYQLNHQKFVVLILHPLLRRPVMRAWAEVLVSPLIPIYNAFLVERDRLSVEVNYNSQTMLLEWLLNNRFDSVQRRITVENAAKVSIAISAYLKGEKQPRLNAYRKGEGDKIVAGTKAELNTVDFLVNIPAALSGQQTPISRLVNKYKISGKTFSIVLA